MSVEEINRKVEAEFPTVARVMEEVGKVIVGQRNMVEKLIMIINIFLMKEIHYMIWIIHNKHKMV